MNKRYKIIAAVIGVLGLFNSYRAGAQLPQCDKIYLDKYDFLGLLLGIPNSDVELYTYDPATPVGPGNPVLNTIAMPTGHGGFTISAVLGSGNTTRTFYTVIGDKYWYYDPTTSVWTNTGHSTGNAAAVNLAAGGDYIYNLVGATGQIYKYDGTGPGTLLITVSDFQGEGPYDLVADCDGNFYLFNATGLVNPPFLRKYSPAGVLLDQWTVSNPNAYQPSGGFAIVGNSFFTDNVGFLFTSTSIASGIIASGAINLNTATPNLPPYNPGTDLFFPGDFGSCDEAIPRLAVITIASSDTVMCGAKETSFWVTNVVNQGDNPQYQWFVNGAAVAGATDTFCRYTPQNGDVVTCQLVSNRRCVQQLTVMSNAITLTVDNAVEPELSYVPNEFCTTVDSVIKPVLSIPGGTFTADAGLSINTATGDITPSQCVPGEYTIIYTNPPPIVCPQYSTTAIVNVYPPAKADIEVGDFPEPVCLGDTVVLHAVETKGNSYFWEPTERIAGPKDQASVAFKRNRSGMVQLLVYAKGGCIARDSIFVDKGVSCCKVFLPTAFSPNADGLNDTWKIQVADMQAINSLKVFNRYGQLVFEGQNIQDSWDGTYNHKPCDPGVYHYQVSYICDNGVQGEKKGDITLIK